MYPYVNKFQFSESDIKLTLKLSGNSILRVKVALVEKASFPRTFSLTFRGTFHTTFHERLHLNVANWKVSGNVP